MKNENTTCMGFCIPKVWQILKRFTGTYFIKHKPLISEEWYTNYYTSCLLSKYYNVTSLSTKWADHFKYSCWIWWWRSVYVFSNKHSWKVPMGNDSRFKGQTGLHITQQPHKAYNLPNRRVNEPQSSSDSRTWT